jgi:hypothetical protein
MVRVAAKRHLANLVQQPDRMTEPWKNATIGNPVLVRDTTLEPAYWITPVKLGKSVLGYIEVTLNYNTIGHAYFYTNPEKLNALPSTVTRIPGDEALRLAKPTLSRYADAKFSKPKFVNDNARGRLAWMIEVRKDRKLISHVFVTPNYVYERQIGIQREHGVRGAASSSNPSNHSPPPSSSQAQ